MKDQYGDISEDEGSLTPAAKPKSFWKTTGYAIVAAALVSAVATFMGLDVWLIDGWNTFRSEQAQFQKKESAKTSRIEDSIGGVHEALKIIRVVDDRGFLGVDKSQAEILKELIDIRQSQHHSEQSVRDLQDCLDAMAENYMRQVAVSSPGTNTAPTVTSGPRVIRIGPSRHTSSAEIQTHNAKALQATIKATSETQTVDQVEEPKVPAKETVDPGNHHELALWPRLLITKVQHIPELGKNPDDWKVCYVSEGEALLIILDNPGYVIVPSKEVPELMDSWAGNDIGCYKYDNSDKDPPEGLKGPNPGKDRILITLKKGIHGKQRFGVKSIRKSS